MLVAPTASGGCPSAGGQAVALHGAQAQKQQAERPLVCAGAACHGQAQPAPKGPVKSRTGQLRLPHQPPHKERDPPAMAAATAQGGRSTRAARKGIEQLLQQGRETPRGHRRRAGLPLREGNRDPCGSLSGRRHPAGDLATGVTLSTGGTGVDAEHCGKGSKGRVELWCVSVSDHRRKRFQQPSPRERRRHANVGRPCAPRPGAHRCGLRWRLEHPFAHKERSKPRTGHFGCSGRLVASRLARSQHKRHDALAPEGLAEKDDLFTGGTQGSVGRPSAVSTICSSGETALCCYLDGRRLRGAWRVRHYPSNDSDGTLWIKLWMI
eukprot:scaffold7115_cov125-Isochrysis_galbana.AAC.2